MLLGRRWLAVAAWLAGIAGIVLAAAAFLPLSGGRGGAGEVPTFTVEARPFLRRVPAEGNLRAAKATPVSVPYEGQRGHRIAWLAPDGSRVRAGEVVVRFDPTEMEKDLATARTDAETALRRADKERAQGSAQTAKLEGEAEIAEIELEAARRFQKLDEEIFSRAEIIESEIDEDLARERARHAREARARRESLSRTELELLDIERGKAAARIAAAEQGLAGLTVTAPHDGILIFQRNWRGEPVRVGDPVWPGQPVAEIPDLAVMVAEVFVLEADAGGLAVGKPARVEIESVPGRVYPAQIARVDSLAKPRRRGSPVQYFAVTLELARTDPERMKPGARVRAWLTLDEVPEALAVPRQAVFELDGKTVAYRRRGRPGTGFAPVPVALGPASMGRVVVTSGLAAGDVVALRDPTRAAGPAPEAAGSEPALPADGPAGGAPGGGPG